jgi:hypothetical protein
MEPADLRCSRNANVLTRPPPVRQDAPITSQKALVGRAQWKINRPPSLERNEQAWREHVYRSTRAIEDRPGYP